jgi:hypothetical protein
MKKLILLTISVTMFGVASYAQQDTTRLNKPVSPQPVLPQPAQPTQPVQQVPPPANPQPSVVPMQPSQQINNQTTLPGWTPVTSPNVPDNLRQTLSNTPQYNGWENGSIYTNPTNDTYQLQLKSNDVNSPNPQVYYFDKDGKLTTKPNDH